MPHSENEGLAVPEPVSQGDAVFPPVTREHILHCSYDYWFPKFRTSCIRSKIIRLNPAFVEYLREDGILLADDEDTERTEDDDWEPSGPSSDVLPPPNIPHHQEPESDSDSEPEDDDDHVRIPPNKRFPDLHRAIQDAIQQLGGQVAPKLNWSSPKDATFISRLVNTMKCTLANDVYTLLKSSNFVTHDLDHAFEDTVPVSSAASAEGEATFNHVLVLRSYFEPMQSMEFRCFVKDRVLAAISARDLNYYPFLQAETMRAIVVDRVRALFKGKLRDGFPDGCFVFDVYIPNKYTEEDDDEERFDRARLIDINPWAPRTDSLLFHWSELLDLQVPQDGGDSPYEPELRVVEKDDPAAYNFSSAQYSAHKLPKDIVDAGAAGPEGMREFSRQWQGTSREAWEMNDDRP